MRARRTDKAHAAIRDALRDLGFSVADTHDVGDGFPDLVIGRYGFDAKVEIKTPKGRKTALDRLQANQSEFRDGWKGSKTIVAYDLEDVLWQWRQMLRMEGWVK